MVTFKTFESFGALDISDGVPLPVGDGGDSEGKMPPPPRSSRPLLDFDKTIPMRKATP